MLRFCSVDYKKTDSAVRNFRRNILNFLLKFKNPFSYIFLKKKKRLYACLYFCYILIQMGVFALANGCFITLFVFIIRLLVVLTVFVLALYVLETLVLVDSMPSDLRRWNANSIARVCQRKSWIAWMFRRSCRNWSVRRCCE